MGNWIAMMIVANGRLRRGDELDDWGEEVVDAPRWVHQSTAHPLMAPLSMAHR